MTCSPQRQPLAPEIRAQKTGLRAWGDFRFDRLSLPLSYNWEAGIVAAGLHAATVVLLILFIGLHMPKPPQDETVISHGLTVLVDRNATLFLIGTTMDYREDKLTRGFTFENPNEKGRCGCGESFHV